MAELNILRNQMFGNCRFVFTDQYRKPRFLPVCNASWWLSFYHHQPFPSPFPIPAHLCVSCRNCILGEVPTSVLPLLLVLLFQSRWAVALACWSIFQTRPGVSWSEDHILLIWASLVTSPYSLMFTARMISKQWCIAVCLSVCISLRVERLSMLGEIWLKGWGKGDLKNEDPGSRLPGREPQLCHLLVV